MKHLALKVYASAKNSRKRYIKRLDTVGRQRKGSQIHSYPGLNRSRSTVRTIYPILAFLSRYWSPFLAVKVKPNRDHYRSFQVIHVHTVPQGTFFKFQETSARAIRISSRLGALLQKGVSRLIPIVPLTLSVQPCGRQQVKILYLLNLLFLQRNLRLTIRPVKKWKSVSRPMGLSLGDSLHTWTDLFPHPTL